jgi:SAM-dependent methyltransferase
MNVSAGDYRARTMQSYDVLAVEIVKGFENYFESVARVEADYFLALLGRDSVILDLGCGGGYASAYFVSQGHKPVSADLSRGMLNVCRSRGVRCVVQLDLETLPFRQQAFDAIWAHTSLIHIPKWRLADALQALGQRLGSNSVLFVALKEGRGEGYFGELGVERWFASFQEGEFEEYIPAGLDIVRHSRTGIKKAAFLNYHLVKVQR